jgi:hypothetical protein
MSGSAEAHRSPVELHPRSTRQSIMQSATLYGNATPDNVDTTEGGVQDVRVGNEPQRLTIWPQPVRYSLEYVGNTR